MQQGKVAAAVTLLGNSDMNTLERLEAAADTLEPQAAWPEHQCWIGGGDEGMSWCEDCAKREVARLSKKHPNREFYVDGGYGVEETESGAACEGCGQQLSYSLLRYGVISEVDHYLENPLTEDEGPAIHYEVVAILRGARYMRKPEDAEIIADALRIGETAVQLLGYRDELARFADDGGPAELRR